MDFLALVLIAFIIGATSYFAGKQNQFQEICEAQNGIIIDGKCFEKSPEKKLGVKNAP